ncbi:undecaprenyl-diphosphatase [Bacilli bacterium PM5-9]|nr:undecaprenyl-diphosphatase [Bacilli bacterium PM5-9]
MNIDKVIIQFITCNRIDILNPVFISLTYLGELMIIWLIITLILLYKNKQLNLLKVFIPTYLISFIINDVIIKNIIQRPRPFMVHDFIKPLVEMPSSYSMPSGHSASSFVAATLLAYYFPKYKVLFYILACLIAFSRVYVGVHFFSDVVLGALVGFIIGKISIKIVKKRT